MEKRFSKHNEFDANAKPFYTYLHMYFIALICKSFPLNDIFKAQNHLFYFILFTFLIPFISVLFLFIYLFNFEFFSKEKVCDHKKSFFF